ncbi:MAG: hypothetical protein DMG64_08960 [Acidobacteria bacterium]|nr:MAG: hypothetical protein DMG63_10140 [Acidobacteriota bacterium]PYY03119.1 MAG: hypothetical protein DMG64_08960 [Acidobacteriota bacterium]PYY24191.1 MAG: hypothetical protein DMG62_04070 [Acidobacteriota bacterium]
MHRLLTFVAAYIISGAMAFAQGTATGQAPARGTQSSGNSVSSTPNSNSTSPSGAQGQASRTPSSPNQALPGDSNPANATTRDAQANGSAVRANSGNGGTPGTAAGNNANSSDNTGLKRDDTGSNPTSGHAPTNITNPGTRGQWFWIALGIFVALVLLGALIGRSRAAADIDQTDPTLRSTREPDVIRREEIYRRRPDEIDRDEDQIRRAG